MSPAAGPSGEVIALKGNVKVSREDWIAVAMDVLISQGVDQVKILGLSQRLEVSRSSFYWYFKSRKALLDDLLEAWEASNTRSLLSACAEPAPSITAAVCNLFKCFVDQSLFDPQLDFAVREWSRRSGPVRRIVDRSDEARLAAIAAMFERHGYAPADAEVRARVLYYMQLGYYALELQEPMEERLERVAGYLEAFTGRKPDPSEIEAFRDYARGQRSS